MTQHVMESSRRLGEVFAISVNGTRAAADWHQLDSSDNLPQQDYDALIKQFGECTRQMKHAYREGFNHSFIHLDRACIAWWQTMSEPAQRNLMFHAETTDIAKAWSWHKWVQIADAAPKALN